MNTRTPRLRFAAALFGAATLALSAATMLTLAPGTARAQATATTDPVGYLSIPLLANSDTFVSIPFTRPAEFTGAVASVSGSTLTFSGTPGFTANAFAPLNAAAPNDGHKTYYAIIGPKNVALTPTLSVTNGSPNVTASAALPADLVAGDQVTVGGLTFTVAAVSGTSLTLDRAYTGTTASGLAATYNHSPSEGRFYTVTANDAGTLTVDLNGDSLTNVTAGTQVSVIPYWTLNAAFPASDAGKSYITSTTLFNRATELVFPNRAGVGINLVPAATYYHFSGAWRKFGDPVDSSNVNTSNDTLIYPDSYFIARNNTNTLTTFSPIGGVFTKRFSSTLVTQTAGKQDNYVANLRPVGVSLKDSGLISSGAFTPSTSVFNRADDLLVYDNNATGKRKVPSATYFYFSGGWRKVGTPVTDPSFDNTVVFTPGIGVIIRKGAMAFDPTWMNTPTY